MCGIFAAWSSDGLASTTQQGLYALRHRGQSAWGVAYHSTQTHILEKRYGMVSDAAMAYLHAPNQGFSIGHVRYPTVGNQHQFSEIQPFSDEAHSIFFVHNGEVAFHHMPLSGNDSQTLFAYILKKIQEKPKSGIYKAEDVVEILSHLEDEISGAYSIILLIPTLGIFLTRDPKGIRPLVYAFDHNQKNHPFIASSESVVFENQCFEDVAPHSVVWFSPERGVQVFSTASAALTPQPCLFEYIYFADPKTKIDDVSVLHARKRLGSNVARCIIERGLHHHIDAVVPIPNSGTLYAKACGRILKKPVLDVFQVKNDVRTFLRPTVAERSQLVREKFSVRPIPDAYQHILLVDDSLVRGTTARHVVQLLRSLGKYHITLALACARVISPNRYGLNIRHTDLLAAQHNDVELCQILDVDAIVFPTLETTTRAVSTTQQFETSMFELIPSS